jgi:hypothetical protein
LNTALTDIELNHLCDFVGYGTLSAKVWFPGMEEAGGGENNLRARHWQNYVELFDNSWLGEIKVRS